MEELSEIPDEWNQLCNYARPRQSLGYLTTMEFSSACFDESRQNGFVFTMW